MLQIKNILGGGKPEGLYAWKKHEIGSELKEINESVSTLPYSFYNGCAVVLNGEIHILGGNNDKTAHYKWDGSSWTSVSTLPYNFHYGSAVVYNNEIHIFGGYDTGVGLNHYKWNGTSWISVSSLPYVFYQGSAVVLNGEIHILGYNGGDTDHYKWDGSSWTSVSTLPYNFFEGSAVVLNNEIHILGGSAYQRRHYKYDGSSWTSVSTLPYDSLRSSAVILDNEIHILGSSADQTNHYKWDGSSWTSVSTLPYNFFEGSAVVLNGGIHILGSSDSSYRTAHYLIIGYAPVYTFLDYIVSDKETAYPDGGEKGGYWYEKVVDDFFSKLTGASKVAIDEFTSASTMNITPTSKPNISHSLGVKPKGYLIYTEDELSVTYGIKSMFWLDLISGTYSIACHYYSGSPYAFEFAGNGNIYNSSITEDSIILINNSGTSSYVRRFQSGKKYKILTWA